MYTTQKVLAKKRGYTPPNYSKEDLYAWLVSRPEFHTLFKAWEDSGFQTAIKPSCDRKNDLISYQLGNLRLVTWSTNVKNERNNRKEGRNNKVNQAVDMFSTTGVFMRRFHSIMEAARFVNGNVANIWGVMNQYTRRIKNKNGSIGRYTPNTAYGYKWCYSSIPNNNEEIRQ